MSLYYLRPRAAGALGGGGSWAFVGTGSFGDWRNVDPGPLLTHDDAVSAIQETTGSSNRIGFLVTPLPAGIASIRRVWVACRLREGPAGSADYSFGVRMGGVDGSPAVVNDDTSGGTYRTNELPATGSIARPGGGTWSLDDLRATTLEVYVANDTAPVSTIDVTSLYIVVDAVGAPVKIGSARDMASRFLRLLRRPTRLISLRAPHLLYAGIEIGDYVTLSHEHGPHPSGTGWGRKPWQRQVLQVMGHEVDLGAKTVKLSLLDVRPYRVLFWDAALTREPPGSQGQGMARLSVGARQFARASKAWIESAAAAAQGAKQLVQLDVDLEKQEAAPVAPGSPVLTGGILLERAATNALLHSAFVASLTGWTASGTPAPATSALRLLFESAVTPNAIRFAPTSLAAACKIQAAAFNPGATTEGCASFWHWDETGHALSYSIQRSSDSKWWNDGTATWDVAQVWNAMPVSTGAWARAASKPLGAGLASTNITVIVGVPTTGTVGQVNYLAHGQAEDCNYPTSAIVTTTAAVTRAIDDLKIENAHGRLVWPRERGTVLFTFTPLWNAADLIAGSNRNLLTVSYDASNLDRVFWLQGTGWRWRRRVAATNYQITKSTPAAVRGTPVGIAIRWASADAEEGMADRQCDLFINGVLAGSITAAARPESFPSISYLQTSSATEPADGRFSGIEVRDYVMSAEEILDLHG